MAVESANIPKNTIFGHVSGSVSVAVVSIAFPLSLSETAVSEVPVEVVDTHPERVVPVTVDAVEVEVFVGVETVDPVVTLWGEAFTSAAVVANSVIASTPSVIVLPSFPFAERTMSEYEELGSSLSLRRMRARLSSIVSASTDATVTFTASRVRVIRIRTVLASIGEEKSSATVRSSTTRTLEIASAEAYCI